MAFTGKPETLARLKEGVEAWNKWIRENIFHEYLPTTINTSELDLAGANLRGVNLGGADLRGVNLSGADLRGADLSSARFEEVYGLGPSRIKEVIYFSSLNGANLSGANLRRANLSGASLHDANLSGVDLRGAELSGAGFHGANLSNSNLIAISIEDAFFELVNLSFADMSLAKLRNGNFSGACLNRANLTGVDLSGANLSRANLCGTNLNRAKLRGANLSETDLTKSDIRAANISEARFLRANLSEVLNLDTCTYEIPPIVDHLTIDKSAGIPESFLRRLGFSEERIRAYLYGTSITIEFTEEGWGDLVPVEKALKVVLGDGYDVSKSGDRIAVKLESPDLMNPTLDAVGAVLAALESESPGEIKMIALKAPGKEREVLTQEERDMILIGMSERLSPGFLSQEERDLLLLKISERQGIDRKPESLVEAVGKGTIESAEKFPFGPLVVRFGEWFVSKVQKPDEDEKILQQIYARFKPAFRALRGVKSLPEKQPRQLPPAGSSKEDD